MPLLCRLFFVAFLLASCAGPQLKLKDWQKLPKAEYTLPPFAKHLARYKIALDPGHGGNADNPGYKRGPTGKREAIMNLNVAIFLKQFLERAGATVFLTRTDDRFISLQDRADLAEAAGCDFMISLHHNSGPNPATNYAAVFYHLTPEKSPISLDLARNIYFGLVEALRLPQVLENGLLSDQLIYPAGFGLLRRSTIPAILLESSFYSNRKEEKRLSDLKYNQREAYGIFLGLARWAAGGVPATHLLEPTGVSRSKKPIIKYSLSDGVTERAGRQVKEQLIFSESVAAKIDGKRTRATLSEDRQTLTFQPDSALTNGLHEIQVDLQNMFKQHNFPRIDTLVISAPTDSIDFRYDTQYLPADTLATMPIFISLYDADDESVWDGTGLNVTVNRGQVAPANPKLNGGKALVYYRPDNRLGLVYLTASTTTFSDTTLLSLTPPGQIWLVSGAIVNDSTNSVIEAATVSLNDSTRTISDPNGVYFFLNPPIGPDTLKISKDGFASTSRAVLVDSSQSLRENFRLKPNLGGLLHGKTVILDAALGGTERGDIFPDSLSAAGVNLDMVTQLAAMLRWAGAKPILVRENDQLLSTMKRVRLVNNIAEGWYLKIAYEKWDQDSVFVQTTIYPANEIGEKLAGIIKGTFSVLPKTSGVILQNTDVTEVTLTNKTALEVRIRCREANILGRDLAALFRSIVEFYRLKAAEAGEIPDDDRN